MEEDKTQVVTPETSKEEQELEELYKFDPENEPWWNR